MKERGIIFCDDMARAVREHRKTETRRVIRFPLDPGGSRTGWELYKRPLSWGPQREDPYWPFISHAFPTETGPTMVRCPYGIPGDRLVLKSRWAVPRHLDAIPPSLLPTRPRLWTPFNGQPKSDLFGRTRSPRFIPTFLYPLFPPAELTDVRVQRVQEISEEDALAEGIFTRLDLDGRTLYGDGDCPEYIRERSARDAYRNLWNILNGTRGHGWHHNDWVWALTFRMEG